MTSSPEWGGGGAERADGGVGPASSRPNPSTGALGRPAPADDRPPEGRPIRLRPPPDSGEDSGALSLHTAFAAIADHWRPRVAATASGQDLRLVKTRGTFPWHTHADADEVFLCWRGTFRIEFRDRSVTLGPGEMLVVPRGTEHRTASDGEAEVLIFEPSAVVNTGDGPPSAFTAERIAVS